jgi:hypothetical protein
MNFEPWDMGMRGLLGGVGHPGALASLSHFVGRHGGREKTKNEENAFRVLFLLTSATFSTVIFATCYPSD